MLEEMIYQEDMDQSKLQYPEFADRHVKLLNQQSSHIYKMELYKQVS